MSYYGMMWGRYGAAQDERGRLYASAYAFPTRAARDHWVTDSPTDYVSAAGYRWSATRREVERTQGRFATWYKGGPTPYRARCGLCAAEYADDCLLDSHERECVRLSFAPTTD